jgi:hypothetical protein
LFRLDGSPTGQCPVGSRQCLQDPEYSSFFSVDAVAREFRLTFY